MRLPTPIGGNPVLVFQVIRLQKFLLKIKLAIDNCFHKELKTSSLDFQLLSISVTSPCPETTIEELGIKSWPIWTCEASSFDWTYDDKETCLLLEGEVTVTPDGGEPVKFGAGDLVVFPTGMDCRWDVRKAVRKHYRFGD